MISKEKIKEFSFWMVNGEMELAWGVKVIWFTLPEFIEYGASLDSRLQDGDNFETRKRQTNEDKFMMEVQSIFNMNNNFNTFKVSLEGLMKKHKIGELK